MTFRSFSFIFMPDSSTTTAPEAVCPHPRPISKVIRHLQGQLVVFTGKLSSLGRKDARALVARLGGATADDVNAKTTMLVVGAEGFAPKTQSRDRTTVGQVQQAETGRGAERRARRSDRGPDRGSVLPADRRADPGRAEAAISRHARPAGALPLASRGSPAVSREVRRHSARAAHQRRHLLRVSRSGRHQAGERRARGRGVVSQRGPRAAGVARGTARVRFPARRRAGEDHDAAAQRQPHRLPRATAIRQRARPASRHGAWPKSTSAPASILDDGDEAKLDEAAAAYRKALESDPYLVAALINLANIHYSRDELAEAQALYERAIGLESDFFEAHFNLGNIYHDLGRFAEAQACYREALRLNPFYADTHFYLAVTLEKMGLSQDARPHWRAYQQLAPKGEWVELAREFSD